MATKSGTTRIATAKFAATATKLGLTITTRAGWLLIHGADKTRRLLVHTGKKGTNCVELVGYEELAHTIAHPCSPAKTMTRMLDCNLTEKEILRNFYKVAKVLAEANKVALLEGASAAAPIESVNAPSAAPLVQPSFEQILSSVA